MSAHIAVVDLSLDLRSDLRFAHQQRDEARAGCDHLAGALKRASAELQGILDTQRERDAAREADMARFVDARARVLLEGESGRLYPAIPSPPSPLKCGRTPVPQ